MMSQTSLGRTLGDSLLEFGEASGARAMTPRRTNFVVLMRDFGSIVRGRVKCCDDPGDERGIPCAAITVDVAEILGGLSTVGGVCRPLGLPEPRLSPGGNFLAPSLPGYGEGACRARFGMSPGSSHPRGGGVRIDRDETQRLFCLADCSAEWSARNLGGSQEEFR